MNTNLLLNKYLEEHYPNLDLTSPLFYNADIGIRFEIGNPDSTVSDEEYRAQVHHRATKLFKETHQENDDILIVFYQYVNKNYNVPVRKRAFDHTLKNSKVIRNLSCMKTNLFDEEDDGWESYQFVLKCKVSDIKYTKLLYSNYDMFFVNTSKHTIFNFYDSRGLDIIANSKDCLKELYINYNDWILDYDREQIDSVFCT